MSLKQHLGSDNVICCADDVGADERITAAVLQLLRAKRIHRASVCVNYPDQWRSLTTLLPYVDLLGLHLNFSSGPSLTYHPDLSDVATRMFHGPREGLADESGFAAAIASYVEKLEAVAPASFANEIEAQWSKFVEIFGQDPIHIDVHHDLDDASSVMSAINAFDSKAPTRRQRLQSGSLAAYLSPFVIPGEDLIKYHERMRQVVVKLPQNSLLAFHPATGLVDPAFSVYRRGRMIEFEYLMNDDPAL